MVVNKTIRGEIILPKGLLDVYIPPTNLSTRWKNWKATIDFKICLECISRHGKIYSTDEKPDKAPQFMGVADVLSNLCILLSLDPEQRTARTVPIGG